MASTQGPNLWQHAGSGIELALIVGLFAALGYGLDQWQDTGPWGVLGGAVFGIVGGLYRMIRDAMRIGRSFNDRGTDSRNDSH